MSRRSDDIAEQGCARPATLEALARRYATPLRRYFERRVRDKADVPDLVQDVLLRMTRLRDLSTIVVPAPQSDMGLILASTLAGGH